MLIYKEEDITTVPIFLSMVTNIEFDRTVIDSLNALLSQRIDTHLVPDFSLPANRQLFDEEIPPELLEQPV